MRQVLVPTDDLESTTEGKYNKGDWMVFITFQKCFTGIDSFEIDGVFLSVFRINFRWATISSRKRQSLGKFWFSIFMSLIFAIFVLRERLKFSQ